MHKTFIAVLTGLLCLSISISAQCSFNATISPNNPILCPNDTILLTTEVYDSYQWYKDGVAISGATNQTLEVTAASDLGSQFYVACTLASCTENSDTILVDGWLFLLPFVITHTMPVETGGSGEAYYCAGTVVELELGLPYTENITWYNDGTPISGEDSTTIFITETGNYTVSGAPSVCPDFIQYLGVTIPIIIMPPFEPDWPDYNTMEWGWWVWSCMNCDQCYYYYIDTTNFGSAVVDSGTFFHPWTSGTLDNLSFFTEYQAVCYDSLGCLGIDTIMLGFESIEEHPFLQLQLFPNPTHDIIQLTLHDDIENYQVRMIDMLGKTVLHQPMKNSFDVSQFASGIYMVEVYSKKYYLRKRFIKT